MLTRRNVLRGRGFQSMDPERARARRLVERASNIDVLLAGKGRMASMSGSTSGQAIDKENASQSQAYQAAVRSIGYCVRCGCSLRKGEGQFCHADQGKGQGIKTDVRRGWLGCAACHHWVGTSGQMKKQQRREEEDRLALKTRQCVRRLGVWPASLPDTWAERDAAAAANIKKDQQ